MKLRLLMLVLTLTVLLTISSFAVTSINASIGVSPAASAGYAAGFTIKSIGTLGFELTVEGTLNSLSDLSQLGNVNTWELFPTFLISLPTGNIRPYVGIGIRTYFSFLNGYGFGPVYLNPLYYHAGLDLFFDNFSIFGEAMGEINNFTQFSEIKEWVFGLGLAF